MQHLQTIRSRRQVDDPPELIAAQTNGYLLLNSKARRAVLLHYRDWAGRYGVPFVTAYYGPRGTNTYALIEVDSPIAHDCPMCLTALASLLAEHNAGQRYGANPGYAYATRIPREHAPFVARRAAALAIRALHCAGKENR